MTVKLYKAVKRHKLELAWTVEVDSSLKARGHNWFRKALDKNEMDVDQDQLNIRDQFPLSGINQGDLLCIGGSQCYIM